MTDDRIAPRPEVWATPPEQHGALDYAELERAGLGPEQVLDFSVNSNPYGPSPLVRQALAWTPLDRYPDREALALRRALSAQQGVALDHILVGNGTAELIWLLAMAFVRPGDRALVVGPTFGEYARAVTLMGGCVARWTARPEQDFAVETTALRRMGQRTGPRIVFLCNPNNPTGVVVPSSQIHEWAAAQPRTLFVIDEAYYQFVPGFRTAADSRRSNLVVLRSMTKDYALAGLRLGYALGTRAVIRALARVRPPWSVNALAQAAGVVALGDREHLQDSMRKLRRDRETLRAGLVALGLHPAPSVTHYFLLPVGNGLVFRRALMNKGILVRDCASFGLPGHVRIATRTPEENARLLEGVREAGK